MVAVKANVKNQYLAALSLNIVTLTYGVFLGWPSASFLLLQSEESPLETGPMTDDDAGWVSSMSFVGGMPAAFIFAWFAGKWGRRISLMLVTLPALLGWLTIPFAKDPIQLSVSRLVGGLASGAIGVIPIYITEVADTNVRGFLGTFLMFSCSLGILLAYVLGYFFSYATVAWIMIIPCLIYFSSVLFLPETPKFLLSQKKFKEAEKSYRFFGNVRTLIPELSENSNAAEGNLQSNMNVDGDNSLSWQDFCNPKARKALLISTFLCTLHVLCGTPAMLNYAATIFQKATSGLSPNMSAIVVGAVQVFGSYISTFLVERSGRKVLLIVSCIGTALGQIGLGMFVHFDIQGFDMKAFSWIPVISFSFANLFSCIGILPLTYVLISELTPTKVLNVGNMICMMWLRMCSFALYKLLPLLIDYMGLHYMMYMFGINCLVGLVFIFMFIPETKGKSFADIQASL